MMKRWKTVLLYLDMPLVGGNEEAKAWLEKTQARLEGIADESYFLVREHDVTLPSLSSFRCETGEEWLSWLEAFSPHTQVVIVPAFAPLLQRSLIEEALEQHNTYLFDYTYAELPRGLMGEVVDSSVASFLKRSLPKGAKMFSWSLKEWLGQDLSSYDCNILYTSVRLLEYRLSFLPENVYQERVLRAMIERGEGFDTLLSIQEWLESHPSVLRQTPTYVEVELTTLHESDGPFVKDLPRNGEMSAKHLCRLFEEMDEAFPDAVISFGLYGEVFVYSEWEKLLQEIAQRPKRRFLLESRGIFLSEKRLKDALSLPNVEVIVDVSTSSPELFSRWKKPSSAIFPFEGLSSLDVLHRFADNPRLFLQITRCTENDKEIMAFYQAWKDFGQRIIIRKPDSLGGKHLFYRVVDLSPIKRTPCISLQRNLVVFFDGTVPLCRQDVEGKYAVGNVFVDGLKACWERLSPAYEKQFSMKGISTPLCENCDDWWIFSL